VPEYASWPRRIVALIIYWTASTLVTVGLIGLGDYLAPGSNSGWIVLGVFALAILTPRAGAPARRRRRGLDRSATATSLRLGSPAPVSGKRGRTEATCCRAAVVLRRQPARSFLAIHRASLARCGPSTS
jgi:hypothetical protein